jgi:hypothetical protein
MTARPKPSVWPSVAELQERRDECLRQMEARRKVLRDRWRRGETSNAASLVDLESRDVVLSNMSARLVTYNVDLERLDQHEIVTFEKAVLGGYVWACACRATGTAPTSYVAMHRWIDHVEAAVWGVEA